MRQGMNIHLTLVSVKNGRTKEQKKKEKDVIFMTILLSKNCITCHTQRRVVKQRPSQEAGFKEKDFTMNA